MCLHLCHLKWYNIQKVRIVSMLYQVILWTSKNNSLQTVEPPIKDTPNKGHLSIKDKTPGPSVFLYLEVPLYMKVC